MKALLDSLIIECTETTVKSALVILRITDFSETFTLLMKQKKSDRKESRASKSLLFTVKHGPVGSPGSLQNELLLTFLGDWNVLNKFKVFLGLSNDFMTKPVETLIESHYVHYRTLPGSHSFTCSWETGPFADIQITARPV